MWTDTARKQLAGSELRLPSDLMDVEWAVLVPLFPARSSRGRPALQSYRQIVEALFYLLRGGLPWRMLPPDLFPPMTTVQHYYYSWRDTGLCRSINHTLLMAAREAVGREASPSAAVIDSQSVKSTECGGPRGYDAGKKIKGRKRHIITDTQGFLVGAIVQTADIQGRDGAPDVLVSIRHNFPWLRHVFADGGYAGDKLRAALTKIGKWTLEIIKRSDRAKGFELLPRRWAVERTFAWLGHNRHLANSITLSIEEEAIIVAFRRQTLLPLGDCLYALQATIPNLTRSSLHRCFQRHGISRLPEVTEYKEPKRKFKTCPIGYFHIDIAEVRTAEGKLHLYVGIDRTSKFAFVQLVSRANRVTVTASAFLLALIAAVPYKIHTVLTDNPVLSFVEGGIQFTFPPRYADGPTATYMIHMFDIQCNENGIEHRLTKIKHTWTNGQVERMNRTIKEATVKRYHYDSHAQLTAHLHDFIDAYNYRRRLKTLKGLTPFEYFCKIWTTEPDRFKLNPTHQMP